MIRTRRAVLHVDLEDFLVSVERSLDASLRDRPVIVGGTSGGVVAAASSEARARGVRAGLPLETARRLCPEAVLRPGDFEVYRRKSDDVSAILLAASRRVERPSSDEALVDLTPEGPNSRPPMVVAESIKDELQRRLGLDASLGLAGARLAARVAASLARPRGLLAVLPGYERSFIASQPIVSMGDLSDREHAALLQAGFSTIGALAGASADASQLAHILGPVRAARLRTAAQAEDDEPIAVSAPPVLVQEDVTLRETQADGCALGDLLESLARRATRRLRPFDLRAGSITVEVRRAAAAHHRTDELRPGISDEATTVRVVRALAAPLLTPPFGVKGLSVRLSRLTPPDSQTPLFPHSPAAGAGGQLF